MQQYNIFQAIPMSFYSKNLYKDVAQNWGIKSFFYLLFILALSWIVATYTMQRDINRAVSNKTEQFFSQFPVITVKDGKISTPENRPYTIISPETKEKIIVIDTSGQTKSVDSKANILVTENQIIITNDEKANSTEAPHTEIYHVPSSFNTTINPDNFKTFFDNLANFIWVFYFVGFVIVSFIYRIFQALLYSLFGKIFSLMVGVPIKYSQILQIALVSITPVIVLSTIFYHFNIHFPLQLLFYVVLAMFYLCYGILANKNQ